MYITKPQLRNGAFSLLEILISVTVIAILAGLLLPVLSSVISSQRRASTLNLIHQISNAIDQYLDDYASLPDDFDDHPLVYLYRNPVGDDRSPYIEIPGRLAAKRLPDGSWAHSSMKEAEVISDFVGTTGENRVRFYIHNVTPPGRPTFTHTIVIRAPGPSHDPADDVVKIYTVAPGDLPSLLDVLNLLDRDIDRTSPRVWRAL